MDAHASYGRRDINLRAIGFEGSAALAEDVFLAPACTASFAGFVLAASFIWLRSFAWPARSAAMVVGLSFLKFTGGSVSSVSVHVERHVMPDLRLSFKDA